MHIRAIFGSLDPRTSCGSLDAEVAKLGTEQSLAFRKSHRDCNYNYTQDNFSASKRSTIIRQKQILCLQEVEFHQPKTTIPISLI
jgi:hypothetical protein